MLLTLAQWVHSTAFSAVLAGSTWAYPVIGGLHVLGIAWFGGAVLLSVLRPLDENAGPRPAILWTGGTVMLLTGALLFATEPLLCAGSLSFRVKLFLLLALVATSKVRSKIGAPLTLTLWAGVLLASRGIAFF
jgi:hypothetical protein